MTERSWLERAHIVVPDPRCLGKTEGQGSRKRKPRSRDSQGRKMPVRQGWCINILHCPNPENVLWTLGSHGSSLHRRLAPHQCEVGTWGTKESSIISA